MRITPATGPSQATPAVATTPDAAKPPAIAPPVAAALARGRKARARRPRTTPVAAFHTAMNAREGIETRMSVAAKSDQPPDWIAAGVAMATAARASRMPRSRGSGFMRLIRAL